ncbi:peptide methionine sulfoxide reductase [Cotesia glomerata]|uniref:peptide-methionine (S)-S-oxide reductase n=1 Tax=Cotesia glomerata TaxID=32391 RepID=A0AAV7HQP3_COTGL|nr:peptide methionine sulfoxide reductase [Cotesia glomerata]XP_044589774.1 peptide methionine sulfoxide reductase [Cotesia glomerata]XP_044589775.1 peptide methionine sulfoxide reductase [Cotesia glomerata]KAH0546462.1 hypothetical protein KQX54_009830 [Cotesia glomerata]
MPDQLEALKKATFGMGCFWACDALFGVAPGVTRTRVGYAGGTKPSPTYKNIGDHTEVVEIEYDPKTASFSQLLSLFWNNHEYGLTKKIKAQYASLILYHDDEQKIEAEKSLSEEQNKQGKNFTTQIKNFDKFYPAEDYHQKYRLQLHTYLVQSLGIATAADLHTPLATRLNGYVAGAGTLDQFEQDPVCKQLNEKQYDYIKKCLVENQGTGLYC